MIYSNSKRVSLERMSAEIINLKDRIQDYQERCHSLTNALARCEKSKEKMKAAYEEMLSERDALIKELTNKVLHLEAVAAHDGTNTGMSTATTPINKKKVIPNSRRGSSLKKGGQPGHEKHGMEKFEDSDITETISHELDLSAETCDFCGGKLIDTGESISKDEFDVEIKVVKRRHEYRIYSCVDCGATVRLPIEKRLKEQNQYGSRVQALALSMMATGNVAVNKARMLVSGMTDGLMCPSEGFICKLYKRASGNLQEFMSDLKRVLITRALLYWDDTVVMIQTKRACMRFYGDETISYYTAHEHKDLEGMLDDQILTALTPETTVMHDHNRVNYNELFCFQNIECNQHLERDLQKIADDNPTHKWAIGMKGLISSTIKKRKDLILKGIESFPDQEIKSFKTKVERFLKKGDKENKKSKNKYAVSFERTVLDRIEKYQENYFRWVEDFRLPTTDNLSERGLRGIKSHMKISGQFDSEKTAKYYATVKTYVETCRKNHINEMEALSRLCAGAPYTVEEIFA